MDSIIGGYEPPCVCRELNSEPTTTESFLQSPEKKFHVSEYFIVR